MVWRRGRVRPCWEKLGPAAATASSRNGTSSSPIRIWGGGEVSFSGGGDNTCVRAAQRPETGSSAQDLSTLPTGV